MRIPSGDLSPARNRRYGGGYGRRRRRRTAKALVVLLLLAAAGGGAYALQRDDKGAPATLGTTPCPTPTVTTAPTKAAPVPVKPVTVPLPKPQQVRLVLLNGTPRNGLAMNVGNELAARGFVISQSGNAPAQLVGASTVSFGPGAQPAATLVAQHLRGATLVSAPRSPAGSVQAVLGSGFVRLANPAELAAAARPKPATATTNAPAAQPTPSASPCR